MLLHCHQLRIPHAEFTVSLNVIIEYCPLIVHCALHSHIFWFYTSLEHGIRLRIMFRLSFRCIFTQVCTQTITLHTVQVGSMVSFTRLNFVIYFISRNCWDLLGEHRYYSLLLRLLVVYAGQYSQNIQVTSCSFLRMCHRRSDCKIAN